MVYGAADIHKLVHFRVSQKKREEKGFIKRDLLSSADDGRIKITQYKCYMH